jgi:hypothetical protein
MFVQSGNGGTSKVDILNSSVHDYQKNGITANEPGTDVNIKGNAVTGMGSDPFNAQNGFRLVSGQRTLDSNSVINHDLCAVHRRKQLSRQCYEYPDRFRR